MTIRETFRVEDYWLIAVSAVSVAFTALFLYAGAMQLRLTAALLGFSGLLFTTYIIRRGYSKRRSYIHLSLCILASILLAAFLVLLTD